MAQTLNCFSPLCQRPPLTNYSPSMSSNQRPNFTTRSLDDKCNRKRRYIQLFEDDENGQKLYAQCVDDGPPRKRHITSTNTSDDIVIDALDRTLSHLSVEQQKPCKKRSFSEMNSECKDCMNQLERPLKKLRLETPKHAHTASVVEVDDSKIEVDVKSDLIPDDIQYAELVNDDHRNALIHKLSHCGCDSVLQRTTRLNQYSGALVPYKKPIARQSWQQMIQSYYEQNPLETDDSEMNEMIQPSGDSDDSRTVHKTRKKRPIRLHSSYAGFVNDTSMNAQQTKSMANQCYVSGIHHHNTNTQHKKNESQDDCMECD